MHDLREVVIANSQERGIQIKVYRDLPNAVIKTDVEQLRGLRNLRAYVAPEMVRSRNPKDMQIMDYLWYVMFQDHVSEIVISDF